jgi:hypothetical protein
MKHLFGYAVIGVAVLGFAFADEPAKETAKDAKSAKSGAKAAEKDTFETLLNLMLKNREDTGALLAKVADGKSAKELKPRLAKLTQEMDGLQERFKKLGPFGAEDEKKLRAGFEAPFRSAITKLNDEAQRIGETDWGRDALSALKLPLKQPETPNTKPAVKKTAKATSK